MKLDVLVRHIEAADPASFREIALLCLDARGFRPEVTDGPDDGGRDLRVFVMPPGARPFAVQVSVERRWQAKLRDDALLAKDKLGVTDLLFVSSRRLPEVDFQAAQDELAGKGVAVQKMDAQGIASLLLARGLLPRALEVLGLWQALPRTLKFERPRVRQEVAWAYAFFGVEPATFRTGVIDRAILTVIANAPSALSKEDVVDVTCLSLGLSANQRGQVESALDRLRQQGKVEGKNGDVHLSDGVLREQEAVRVLRARSRDELITALATSMGPWVRSGPRRDKLAHEIIDDVSALLLDDARVMASALVHERSAEAFTEARERMRRLGATLMSFGLDDAKDHRAALVALSEAVRRSSLGRFLLAGEVFVNLVGLKTSQVVSALGARRALRVVLDASVAMPLLAGLLFEPAQQRYSLAARHAYDQALSHGIEMMIPADYVEEMAAHLLDAWSYRDLVDTEPDLRASKNAFVSHFLGLRGTGAWAGEPGVLAFERYLGGFGFRPAYATLEFAQARTSLEQSLAAALGRYHLRIERLSAPHATLSSVHNELLRVLAESPRRTVRPEVLLRHDARTLAWLDALPMSADATTVLCTWDRLIFDLHERRARVWETLTPAQLGDVLALAAPDEEDGEPVSVLDVALSLADEDAEKGAMVLDRLVSIEKSKLHDAELLAQARRFKEEWVLSTHVRSLEEAWAEWKRDHLSAGPNKPPAAVL